MNRRTLLIESLKASTLGTALLGLAGLQMRAEKRDDAQDGTQKRTAGDLADLKQQLGAVEAQVEDDLAVAAMQTILLRFVCDTLSQASRTPLKSVYGIMDYAQRMVMDGLDARQDDFWAVVVQGWLEENNYNIEASDHPLVRMRGSYGE